MVTWIILILGFFLSALTAIISFRDKTKDFKSGKVQTKSYRWTFAVAILGSLLALLTNIGSNQEKEKASRRAKVLNDSLFKSQEALIESQNLTTSLLLSQRDSTSKVILLQEKVINTQTALNSANSRIEYLQKSITTNLLGDGTFPKLTIAPASPGKYYNNLQFLIGNPGKTPLRGIKAVITDMYSDIIYDVSNQTYKSKEKADTTNLPKGVINMQKEIAVGNLPAGGGRVFYYPQLPVPVKDFGYHIEISWDNGFFITSISGIYGGNKRFPKFKLDYFLCSNGQRDGSNMVVLQDFNLEK